MRRPLPLRVPVLLAFILAAALPGAASAGETSFKKIPCADPVEGVVVCNSDVPNQPGAKDTRIESFDFVPLDVRLVRPAGDLLPRPTLVYLHGWGGSKSEFTTRATELAKEGWNVLTYSARGWADSCGRKPSLPFDTEGCLRGHIRLADFRAEVRDTQHLLGLLVDDGIADRARLAATGVSYGGGQTVSLSQLVDRMYVGGNLVPWTSRAGVPLRLAAALPVIPWTDLTYSLIPNGRHLDYAVADPRSSISPVGVLKQSYVAGLYGLGNAGGTYSAPGLDPTADLTTWFARANSGEPYDADPTVKSFVTEVNSYKSGYSVVPERTPVPTLIANGWTDDLFPVDEALRLVNRTKDRFPEAHIALIGMDFGHARGQGKAADADYLWARQKRWLEHHVLARGDRPADDVTALTQTCPKDAPSGGPFVADSWAASHPGALVHESAASQTILSSGGDSRIGKSLDPIAGDGACASVASADQQGTATYRMAKLTSDVTLLGSPTVVADLAVEGAHAQLAARLWDVDGDKQTLVARTVMRPDPSGRQVFQLHPNAYRFAAGRVIKLELLGSDAPYARPSNGAFRITARNLVLQVPTRERPGQVVGAGTAVQSPPKPVAPAGTVPAPGVTLAPVGGSSRKQSALVRSRSVRVGIRCRKPSAVVRVAGKGRAYVRSVSLKADGRRVRGGRLSWTVSRRTRRLVLSVVFRDGTKRVTGRNMPCRLT